MRHYLKLWASVVAPPGKSDGASSGQWAAPFAEQPGVQRFFDWVTRHPRRLLAFGVCALVAALAMVPQLEKNTSADAFIDPASPALKQRDRVKELFGLRDPIVIAVIRKADTGIYEPATLELVQRLTDQAKGVANVDPNRVTSLATEKNVAGTDDALFIEGFFASEAESFQAPVGSTARAEEIRAAIDNLPLYQGNLVARDGTATVIVVEMMDSAKAETTYQAITSMVESAVVPEGTTVHVAGEGAISGYLSRYIDADAMRLNPIAGLAIALVLASAFWTVSAVMLPTLIILATVVGTVGAMAALGSEFYVITNGLVVNLIGIAVADSVHILTRYEDERRQRPDTSKRELVVSAMCAMWRPVTLTTATTMAGFLALGLSSDMPPMRDFGLYGALGVALAWLTAIFVLPAAMVLWPGRRFARPRGFLSADRQAKPSIERAMTILGDAVAKNPRKVTAIAGLVVVAGIIGASHVRVEESFIEYFQPSEPIHRADTAVNAAMDGTYHLDVVVETAGRDGLHDPEKLRRMADLQTFLETQPHVGGTTSIADYAKQLNQAVSGGDREAHHLPTNRDMVSQLFFLQSAVGDPADLEEEIDLGHQKALVRANVKTDRFSNNRSLVPAVKRYVAREFNGPDMKATVTGRLNLDYHWIEGLVDNHARGVIAAAVVVFLMAWAMFRSLTAGLLTMLPVGTAVLLIYAVMGLGGIWLGVATSMFAAIGIGLGVDFAIHMIDRLRAAGRTAALTDGAMVRVFATTGRALLVNGVAVAIGFGVLMASKVPPLSTFGLLVAVAVVAAFVAAVTTVPALVKLLRPGFFTRTGATGRARSMTRVVPLILAVVAACVVDAAVALAESSAPDGREIMRRVVAREEGDHVVRDLRMELTDRSGATRIREAKVFRETFETVEKLAIFFQEPANIAGTAFLTYDYKASHKADDQWLYLPALRKARRISAANRGDYFLGTDFSYEEIKNENKIELSDYTYEFLRTDDGNDGKVYVVEGQPATADITAELGYSRVVWHVDPTTWLFTKTDFWDPNGNHLKTLRNVQTKRFDDIWVATHMTAVNHKTGHRTVFVFSNFDYESEIPDWMFEKRALRRGL